MLKALLARGDLDEATQLSVIAMGLRWVAAYPRAERTPNILSRLLNRSAPPVVANASVGAVAPAIAWLTKGDLEEPASWVLEGLLARSDLDGETIRTTIAKSASRIVIHPQSQGMKYLLRELLSKRFAPGGVSPLNAEQADLVTRTGLAYLDESSRRESGADVDSDYIFTRLLRRSDLTDDKWRIAAQHAIRWIEGRLDGSTQLTSRRYICDQLTQRWHLLDGTSQSVATRFCGSRQP